MRWSGTTSPDRAGSPRVCAGCWRADMPRHVIRLPDVGEGIAEAELVAWHVEIGDSVAEDQPLAEVMTDKATVELPSPWSGRVVSRNGTPGERLRVGSEL